MAESINMTPRLTVSRAPMHSTGIPHDANGLSSYRQCLSLHAAAAAAAAIGLLHGVLMNGKRT
jgi:hypothetical protein